MLRLCVSLSCGVTQLKHVESVFLLASVSSRNHCLTSTAQRSRMLAVREEVEVVVVGVVVVLPGMVVGRVTCPLYAARVTQR